MLIGSGRDSDTILFSVKLSTGELTLLTDFPPDGKQVLFTSDDQGYGNVYLADVPSFDALPESDRPA